MKQLLSIVIRSLLAVLALVPLKLIAPMSNVLGWFLWVSNSRAKKTTLENLAICFPEKSENECNHIAKQRMKQLSMTALELAPAWSWPVSRLLQCMELPEQTHLLDKLVAKGKGVILLVPHHGNWEMLGPYVGSRHKLVCLFQPPKIDAVGDIVFKSRSRYSTELAPTNTKGVKVLLKALKRGDVISILPDQVPPEGSGEFVSFFGVPALTMTLVYNLLQRTEASVAICYAKRVTGSKHFRLVFKEAPQALYSCDCNESLRALNTCVEQVALDCPEQYQWEYKRFKRQPDGRKFYN